MKPSPSLIERLRRHPFTGIKSTPLAEAADFSELYESTYPSVYRYIYGLTGGPAQEAEDLCIETYLRAWKNRRQYHGETQDAIAWLIRIARNLVVDTYRYEMSRNDHLANELDDDALADDTPTPEEHWIKREEREMVLDMLQTLSPQARETLVLRYILGWKVNEIAAYFEMLENTVSVNIHRSLERLKKNWPLEKD